jgi:flagellar FliL protein
MQDTSAEGTESEETVEKVESPKKKLPILLIVGLIVLLAGIGVGAKFLLGKHHKSKPVVVVEKVGESVPLDEFMMNLADPSGDHYLKMTLALGLKQGVTGEKFKDQIPAARDAIVMVLSAKKLSDVDTIPGKIELKQEIKDSVNKALGEDDVVDVYYQAFATQ